MKLELISFDLCPYVQRSVIALKHKGAKFEITYIDLENPPEWLDRISPLGKVPVLKVDDETAIFESAVINEYLDETIGAPLHSKDPLRKALERAWIEFGSELMMSQFKLFTSKDSDRIEEKTREFFEDFARLDRVTSASGPFFRGKEFSLVDCAYAPMFMRLLLSPKLRDHAGWRSAPRVRSWADHLLELPEVMDSVKPGFANEWREYMRGIGSPLF